MMTTDMTELSRRGRAAYWVVAALAWAGVAAESLSSLSMLRDLRDACVGGLVDA